MNFPRPSKQTESKTVNLSSPRVRRRAGGELFLFKFCVQHLEKLTRRTDFQVVVLYDHGSKEPWCITTDSLDDKDLETHIKNCASGKTLEEAMVGFAENLAQD